MKTKLEELSRDELITIVDGRQPSTVFAAALAAIVPAVVLSIALYVSDATTPGVAYVHLGPCATAIFMACFICLMFQFQSDRKLAALIQLLRKSDVIPCASKHGVQ